MTLFRALLIAMFLTVLAYTAVVISAHGWDFLPVFAGELKAMTWSGQFNLDFTCMLILAGLWMAWRHHFSPAGIALGLSMLVGGSPLLTVYLLVASYQSRGDARVLLVGPRR